MDLEWVWNIEVRVVSSSESVRVRKNPNTFCLFAFAGVDVLGSLFRFRLASPGGNAVDGARLSNTATTLDGLGDRESTCFWELSLPVSNVFEGEADKLCVAEIEDIVGTANPATSDCTGMF